MGALIQKPKRFKCRIGMHLWYDMQWSYKGWVFIKPRCLYCPAERPAPNREWHEIKVWWHQLKHRFNEKHQLVHNSKGFAECTCGFGDIPANRLGDTE